MYKGREPFLDRKQCFDLWVELGSIQKVQNYFYQVGIVNPKNGKKPSPSGVKIAAFKYILFNPEEARKVFVRLGHFGDDKDSEWIAFLRKRARDVLSNRYARYMEWENDVLQPYIRRIKGDN